MKTITFSDKAGLLAGIEEAIEHPEDDILLQHEHSPFSLRLFVGNDLPEIHKRVRKAAQKIWNKPKN